jgi:hypothetical protein
MNEEQRSQVDHPWGAVSRLRQLGAGTDYFYCSECRRHVPCERLEGDTWEVQCSRCVGDCGLCDCNVTGEYRDKNGARVQFHIHIARGGSIKLLSRKGG